MSTPNSSSSCAEKCDAVNLIEIRDQLRAFAAARDWNQYHTPRNLLMALVGEVGELSELFQWRGEVANGLPYFSVKDKSRVGEEMADILMYLVRMADKCDIDLGAAFKDKIAKNNAKYPAELVRGRSEKYTEYQQQAREKESQIEDPQNPQQANQS